MAVIEIAKIQVRRGQKNVTGEPVLDSGEFGWATDAQELWIGNGSTDPTTDGAPQTGITRILTTNDLDLFTLATVPYQYLTVDGTTSTTHRNPSALPLSNTRPRPLANKLDDFVTIYDFGGVNDGRNNRLALQNAIDNLWLNYDRAETGKERGRVALKIPAGVYTMDGTIYLPPNCTLIGDGQDKTIIRLSSTATNKTLLQTCDTTSVPHVYKVYNDGATTITNFISNITLEGMTFEFDPAFGQSNPVLATKPLVRFDCVTDSRIIDCRFKGYIPISDTIHSVDRNAASAYTALEIRGQGVITTKNLLIDKCTFDGFFYGIYSNYDIEDVTIQNSVFRYLHNGIVGGEALGLYANQIGPSRTKIQNNNFYNIEKEAIYFYANPSNTPTYNISANNTFKEVGNNMGGDTSPNTAILNFQSEGNKSVNDHFNRFSVINADVTGATFRELLEGTGYYEDTAVITKTITSGNNPLAKFPISNTQAIKVQYSLIRGSSGSAVTRKGDLLINAMVSVASITDSYSYTGPNNGNVDFSVSANTLTNTITLSYTDTGGIGGTISYKHSQMQ